MRSFAISDIHSNYNDFLKALKIMDLKDDDVLYILGDVLDRGHRDNGVKLLKFIKDYAGPGRFIMLKGNHELFLQMYLEQAITDSQLIKWGGGDTVSSLKALSEEEKKSLFSYVKSLPLYVKISTRLFGPTVLTHSGLSADYLIENSDNSINVTSSIETAAQKSEFDFLISDDIHYLGSGVARRLDSYLIVGHKPTINFEPYVPEVLKKTYFMDIDTGAGHKDDGGRMSFVELDSGRCYNI